MAGAIRPSAGRTLQPTTIDWSHPLARGLVMCLHAPMGVGSSIDLVRKRTITTWTGVLADSNEGKALSFPTQTEKLRLPVPLTDVPATLFCEFDAESVSGGFGFLISLSNASDHCIRLGLNQSTGQTLVQHLGTASATANGPNFSFNGWHSLGGVLDSAARRRCYYDGVAGSDNTTSITSGNGYDRTSIGYYSGSFDNQFFGGFARRFRLYNRALPAYEVKALHDDPDQMLVSYGRRSYFIAAVRAGNAGNNSIAVPAASLTLTGFAPTVVVSGNSIAVPAGALTLTGFAPTVSRSYINTNVALQANGGTASASSTFGDSNPAFANDGIIGKHFSSDAWADATSNTFPDWLQVVFSATKTIERIVVYSVQDGPSYTSTPSDTLTASVNQLKDFEVQGWNGSGWDTLGSVTGNALVKRTFDISPYTTDRIRVYITAVGTAFSLIDEVEAYAVNAGTSIAVPAGSLTLAALVPTVAVTGNLQVAVPAGSLTITGNAPTVTVSDHKSIAVPAGSLSLTAQTPTVAVSNNQAVAVPAGSLTLTGLAPAVTATANQAIAVPAGALTLTGFAPAAVVSANQSVPVPAGSLLLTGLAPDVETTAHQFVAVPAGSLTLTGFAPTIAVSGNQQVGVPVGTLVLTAYAPNVVASLHQVIAVPAGELTLTGHAPSVVVSDHQRVDVPAASLELTGLAPDVDVTGNVWIDVPAASLGLEVFAPDVIVGAMMVIDVPAGEIVLTGYAPVVSFHRKVVQIRLCASDAATGDVAIGDVRKGSVAIAHTPTGLVDDDVSTVKCQTEGECQ